MYKKQKKAKPHQVQFYLFLSIFEFEKKPPNPLD